MVINMHEAKTNLSRLVARALAGEDIVIGKAGEPQVRLVPYVKPKPDRKPGAWKGRVWISPDFDAPLDPEVQAAFEGTDFDDIVYTGRPTPLLPKP